MSQDACTAGLRLESRVLDIGNLGGEGRKTLAPQGLRLESREWISETSEVRVARLLHRRDYVWNPGYGYRFSRGGEDQEIVALRGLRLEYRVRTSFIPRR